jgi:DNA-binding LytR/AlgR family response regulator
MLNLDDTAKPAGNPSVQPPRDGRKASRDERRGELTSGAPPGTKRAALAPYFWLALVVVVNLVVSALSSAQEAAQRGRPYDLKMPLFYEGTAALATLLLLPALRRGIRFLSSERSATATLAIAAVVATVYSAAHMVLIVLFRKLGFAAMGGAYGFDWTTQAIYEYRHDLVAALVLGGGFWLFDRKGAEARPPATSAAAHEPQQDGTHLWLRDGSTAIRVDARDILGVGSAGNYVEFQLADRRHLIRGTLAAEEARLRPFGLRRVHRTKLANLNRVVAVELKAAGDFVLRMDNGELIPGSRRYKDALAELPAAIGGR